MFTLLHMLAAVDGDIGAGDEGSLIGGQVCAQARDLLGFAETADRDLRQDFRIEHVS